MALPKLPGGTGTDTMSAAAVIARQKPKYEPKQKPKKKVA
jgi:hypothetical protein